MTEYYDRLETRSGAERKQALVHGIRDQLIHAKAHTRAYATALDGFDCAAFSSLDDLNQYPLTRKSDLVGHQAANPPMGGLVALAPPDIRYIHVSPGPIYEACSYRPDFWRLARPLFVAGFRAGDLVQNCFSYHLTPAGAMLDSGLHALGCTVIPGGVGQAEMQVRTITDLKPVGYVGTPSFLKIILEKADDMRTDVRSIEKGLVSGEALPPPLRAMFSERGVAIVQAYATADLGVIAYETIPDAGLVVDEGVHVEIIRPGGSEPAPDGEVGEVVVTSLNPDYPLIRFATGDLSAMMDGVSECGRTNRRIRGWMGRADQTAKVRGMFIHPQQIHEIVKRHREVEKARLVIDWIDQEDDITLQCETNARVEGMQEAIAQSIRDVCKVRGNVKLVALNSIANDGVVIEDIRNYE
ncbi:MAG: AMP-binding protein [Gammaproteobacteria bacterium]|nr:AMP-binding protein [Gammaproteobacteria bacterium]